MNFLKYGLRAALIIVAVRSANAQSPSTLLTVPSNPIGYYDAQQRARELVAAGSPAAAEPLAEQLVSEYPRDGENWVLLAHIKRALNKHAEAAAAYEKAGPLLGWGVFYLARINAATNHLAAGNRRAALDALRRDVFEDRNVFRASLYSWPGLEALRDDPEFLEIAGRINTSGWTRNDGWNRDVDYLMSEFRRVHPDFRDAPLPDDMIRRVADLKAKIPTLSDEQIFIGMQKIFSTLRQGHINLFPPSGARQLPLQLYVFPEGIYIVDAREPYAHLVGSRLITIESTPAWKALEMVNETQTVDGIMKKLWIGPFIMGMIPYMKGLGITNASDSVTITVESGSATRTVKLATVEVGSRPKLGPPRGVAAPLWLRDVQQSHWETALPEHDALYVQMNQVTHDPNETLPQFGRRIRGVLANTKRKNLIIDLRHNNGGSTNNYPEFLRTVVGYSAIEGNRVYVLIGRGTYSATGNLITDLERLASPVFVGEASSECCNLYGDPARVELPYSHIAAELTAVKWNLSRNVFDARLEMSPHVPVQLTAGAYFTGKDPALETVLQLIKRTKPAT